MTQDQELQPDPGDRPPKADSHDHVENQEGPSDTRPGGTAERVSTDSSRNATPSHTNEEGRSNSVGETSASEPPASESNDGSSLTISKERRHRRRIDDGQESASRADKSPGIEAAMIPYAEPDADEAATQETGGPEPEVDGADFHDYDGTTRARDNFAAPALRSPDLSFTPTPAEVLAPLVRELQTGRVICLTSPHRNLLEATAFDLSEAITSEDDWWRINTESIIDPTQRIRPEVVSADGGNFFIYAEPHIQDDVEATSYLDRVREFAGHLYSKRAELTGYVIVLLMPPKAWRLTKDDLAYIGDSKIERVDYLDRLLQDSLGSGDEGADDLLAPLRALRDDPVWTDDFAFLLAFQDALRRGRDGLLSLLEDGRTSTDESDAPERPRHDLGIVDRSARFLGLHLPRLSPHQFDLCMRALVEGETHEWTEPITEKHKDDEGEILTRRVDQPRSQDAGVYWEAHSAQVFRRIGLDGVDHASGSRVLDFTSIRDRRRAKELTDDLFAIKLFERLIHSGLPFSPSTPTALTNHVLDAASRFVRSFPDRFNGEWLWLIVQAIHQWASEDALSDQARVLTEGGGIKRLLVLATQRQGFLDLFRKFVARFAWILLDEPKTSASAGLLLKRVLLHPNSNDAEVLISHLGDNPRFDELAWWRRLLDRPNVSAQRQGQLKYSIFRSLEGRSRTNGTILWNTLDTLVSWLPSPNSRADSRPAQDFALRFLTSHFAESTRQYDERRAKGLRPRFPLLERGEAASSSQTEERAATIASLLFHPGLITLFEDDEGSTAALAIAHILETWSRVAEDDISRPDIVGGVIARCPDSLRNDIAGHWRDQAERLLRAPGPTASTSDSPKIVREQRRENRRRRSRLQRLVRISQSRRNRNRSR